MPKSDKAKVSIKHSVQTTMGEFFSKSNNKSSTKRADKADSSKDTKNSNQSKLKAKGRPMMWGNWAAKDTEEYRNGYPGKKDHPNKKDNLLFYKNQLKSQPDGDKIDDIHAYWYGDYERLERHHGYIQWLFPIRETGLNWHSQELQLHEIKGILEDKVAKKRILTSYKMMLDFYGMKLKDEETGEIERAENWRSRFRHLNRSFHNYLRITRILKCLGEFEYEYLKPEFVKFILREGIIEKTLDNLMESCQRYWIPVIRDETIRDEVVDYYDNLEHRPDLTDDRKEGDASVSAAKKEKKKIVVKAESPVENGNGDQDTMEYAMSMVSDPADRQTHTMSESDEESQEAIYWQENNNSANADADKPMEEGDEKSEKLTDAGESLRSQQVHDGNDMLATGSDEVAGKDERKGKEDVNKENTDKSLECNESGEAGGDLNNDTEMVKETNDGIQTSTITTETEPNNTEKINLKADGTEILHDETENITAETVEGGVDESLDNGVDIKRNEIDNSIEDKNVNKVEGQLESKVEGENTADKVVDVENDFPKEEHTNVDEQEKMDI